MMRTKITFFYLKMVKKPSFFQVHLPVKSFFSLRYKEETGKDYNKIVLYLCKLSDFNFDLNSESDRDTDELVEEPEKK